MALRSTGTISLSEVNTELAVASTTAINLNQTNVRSLAGKASGLITMNDLYGKSSLASWTVSTISQFNSFDHIVDLLWNGTQFVAGQFHGQVAYSTDAINWTLVTSLETLLSNTQKLPRFYARVGTTYATVGYYNDSNIYYSSNLVNWYKGSVLPLPIGANSGYLCSTGSMYLTCAGNYVYRSPTGAGTFAVSSTPLNSPMAVASSGTVHMVLSNNYATYSSTDAIYWTVRTNTTMYHAPGTIFEYVNSKFIACGYGAIEWTANNGVSWNYVSIAAVGASINCIAWNGSYYLIGTDQGTLFKSTDLTNWTNVSSWITGWSGEVNRLLWVNSKWYACGAASQIARSPLGY